jgi:hypothetical protein
MKCRLNSFMMPDGPPYYASGGGAKAITRCEMHNWTFDGPVSELCPIGRIEQATEDAIARIIRAEERARWTGS